MKQPKLLLGMAMLATLGLAACSNELPVNEPGNATEGDNMRYVAINISNVGSNGTRAASDPTFEVGLPQESDVNNVYLVFYDENKNVVGNIVSLNNADFNKVESNPSINSNHSAVVGVEVLQGETPAYVMCYINPISPEGMLNPVNVIETLKRGAYMKDGYFAMSNSVHYEELVNANGQKEWQLVNATPVKKTFASAEEARKWLNIANGSATAETGDPSKADAEAAITDIYVERYAAKVKFAWAPTDKDNQPITNPEYTGITADATTEGTTTTEHTASLVFNPKGWAINGEGKDFYIIKTFRAPNALGGITGTNYTYSELTNPDKLGANTSTTNWLWNSQENHRSYWSCSPAYYSTQYPQVAADYSASTSELTYQTWADLMKTSGGTANSMDTEFTYMRETTVGNNGLHNATNHYAALPSVIVNGSYTVKYDDAELAEGTTFYLYGTAADGSKSIYFENTQKTETAPASTATTVKDKDGNVVTGTVSLLERLGKRQQIIFKRKVVNEGTTLEKPGEIENLTNEDIAAVMEIGRPDDAVLGSTRKLAARKKTIQIKENTYTINDNAGNTWELVYANGATWVQINSQTTLTQANTNLMQAVNFADEYTNGMAYYFIPIQHYGWWRANNPNANASSINWDDTRVGDFGVVRNHVYDIKVTKVNGLATAISDETDPIIPPQETEIKAVAYRINILNWAVVPDQNVEL